MSGIILGITICARNTEYPSFMSLCFRTEWYWFGNTPLERAGRVILSRLASYLSSSHAKAILGVGVRCDGVGGELHTLYTANARITRRASERFCWEK